MSARQLHLFRSRRQRGVAAPPPSEFELQCMVADDLRRWATPNWIWTHFPAGERRDDVTGARLKRMGLIPGIPDFLLFPPVEACDHHCHFLELKRPGRKLTEHQAGFALWCQLNNYPHAVTSDYRTAVRILQAWGALRSGVRVQ